MEDKELILEMLDIIADKIKRGECTKRQTDALYDVALNYFDVEVTSEELAKHYGKTVEAVHGVIKRRMFEKPKKNLTFYSFRAFRKIVPASWLRKTR